MARRRAGASVSLALAVPVAHRHWRSRCSPCWRFPSLALFAVAAVYPVALALGMAGLDQRRRSRARACFRSSARASAQGRCPRGCPALVLALAVIGVLMLGLGVVLMNRQRQRVRRTTAAPGAMVARRRSHRRGGAIRAATTALWGILKGGAALRAPDARDLGRRYADLLTDNLGHPGLPRAAPRRARSRRAPGRRLRARAASRIARRSLPRLPPARRAVPRRTTWPGSPASTSSTRWPRPCRCPASASLAWSRLPTETFWRGESHRLSDRTASLGRLLEEAAAAGAEQLILVSAAPEPPAATCAAPGAIRRARAGRRASGVGGVGGPRPTPSATCSTGSTAHT